MDPELLINSPESDEDLFDIGYPPSTGQQSDLSQASERSRVRSAISVPHTSRHRSHSSSPNEIPPTPDRSQALSTPPASANNRGHNRHSQLQSPHHRQPASFAAPGHSQPPATRSGALNTPLGRSRAPKRSPNSGGGQSFNSNVS
ncbi:RING finger and transmembrane domain containing protein 2 [Dissostichus eleginoides]|uniref:RING finger and transmembrane domain containing protein 2 n=1 Tax=Dissostichus eleginoides TaxID=100907 RepID=A0AAD9CM04_DISEL|nr:RING finger and transmembrane domain containing protein 2 [Dissostichus eleginoides]